MSGVLGQINASKREKDAFEKNRNSFQDEIVNEVEKMSKVMRVNLLKLRKESKKIEFGIHQSQMRSLNEIRVNDLKGADEQIALNLKVAEELERNALAKAQEDEAGNKKAIQEIKKEMKKIIILIKELHLQTNAVTATNQTFSRVQILIRQKREAAALAANNLELRERKERMALEASHVRLAQNLLEWQRLELQNFDEAEQERVRRINKIRAKHLKEMQQKESDQLKEIQRIKATQLNALSEVDLEHLMNVENLRTNHQQRMQDVGKLERSNRRKIKDIIRQLHNESRARTLKDNQVLTAEKLRRTQNERKENQEKASMKKRKDFSSTLENELAVKLEDLENSLENLSEFVSSDSDNTGSRNSERQSRSSKSHSSLHSENYEIVTEEQNAEELNSIETTIDEAEGIKGKKEDLVDHSAALTRAEGRLKDVVSENEQMRNNELKAQQEEITDAVHIFEDKRRKLQSDFEKTLFGLMKQHSEEKIALTKTHEKEIESLMNSLTIEREFEITRDKAEDQARKQNTSFKALLTDLSDTTKKMTKKNITKEENDKIVALTYQLHMGSAGMCRIVRNVLDYTHLIQQGTRTQKLTYDLNLDHVLSDLISSMQFIGREYGITASFKTIKGENVASQIRVHAGDLTSIMNKLFEKLLVNSNSSNFVLSANQYGSRIVLQLKDDASTFSLAEVKKLEKAFKSESINLSSDNFDLFGIMIAHIISKSMEGELSVIRSGTTDDTGAAFSFSFPVFKENQ